MQEDNNNPPNINPDTNPVAVPPQATAQPITEPTTDQQPASDTIPQTQQLPQQQIANQPVVNDYMTATAASPATPPNNDTLQPTLQAPQGSNKKKREGGVFSFILTIVAALILVQVINHLLFQSYRVVGESMLPTLHAGDLLIISKVGRTTARINSSVYEPKRGDVIVFHSPKDELQLVKRVIGMPGERVVVRSGKITIFNDKHPRGFNPDSQMGYGKTLPPTSGNVDITVPEGHLFVSGDNREGGNSLDSRNELGTIPEDSVVGNLVLRIWPLDKAEFF